MHYDMPVVSTALTVLPDRGSVLPASSRSRPSDPPSVSQTRSKENLHTQSKIWNTVQKLGDRCFMPLSRAKNNVSQTMLSQMTRPQHRIRKTVMIQMICR